MSGLLSDAELHGLIDGQIEVHRRADILRRAASSTSDRERIGNWQSQCELIRSAFRGIEREPLPTTLDLRAPARLHAVSSAPAAAICDDPPILVDDQPRSRLVLPALAALIATGGLAATWLAGGFSLALPEPVLPGGAIAQHAVGGASAAPRPAATAVPSSTIPDLSTLGFTLTAAEVQPGEQGSILFRYRNADAEQITLAVSRGQAGAAAPAGRPLTWHAGNRTYALAGDLPPDELRALVPTVRVLSLDE